MPVLFLLLLLGSYTEAKNVTYSFRVPKAWGTMALWEAACCPRLNLPTDLVDPSLGPQAVGLGVQKGGSSSLSLYMSRHPSYILSEPKETHFFDKTGLHFNITDYQITSWGNQQNNGSIRFDFTPSYLWVPFAACRIKKAFPEMKMIVALRDPADRAYSEFDMVRVFCNKQNMCDWIRRDYHGYIERGIRDLRARRCSFENGTGEKTWNDCFQCLVFDDAFRIHCENRPYTVGIGSRVTCLYFGEQMVSRGLYAGQLAWWFQLFPPKNFFIVSSNEFFKTPLKLLKRLNAFFGVKKPFDKSMIKSIEMKGVYKFKDPNKDKAKILLRSFYKRPNEELYRLLDEVGLGPFPPFESFQKPIGSTTQDKKSNTGGKSDPTKKTASSAPVKDANSKKVPPTPTDASQEHIKPKKGVPVDVSPHEASDKAKKRQPGKIPSPSQGNNTPSSRTSPETKKMPPKPPVRSSRGATTATKRRTSVGTTAKSKSAIADHISVTIGKEKDKDINTPFSHIGNVHSKGTSHPSTKSKDAASEAVSKEFWRSSSRSAPVRTETDANLLPTRQQPSLRDRFLDVRLHPPSIEDRLKGSGDVPSNLASIGRNIAHGYRSTVIGFGGTSKALLYGLLTMVLVAVVVWILRMSPGDGIQRTGR